MHTLDETVSLVSKLGIKKANKTLKQQLILGFIAGAMISLGYLAYIKLVGTIDGGLGVLLGSSVFPIGLIVILLAGGELITGNMMVVGTAYFKGDVTLGQLVKNWIVITFANLLGALFIAFVLGKTEVEHLSKTIIAVSQTKVSYTPLEILISGIGCNWFVGLAVWLNIAIKDGAGKILGIWFPVMVFVLLGFQHSVANMFLLSAGVNLGGITISQLIINLIFSYVGNIIGGAVLVGCLYVYASGSKNPGH